MKQQICNVVIAAMLCTTALYGLGSFDKKEKTYATAYFDGGFQKIGEISEQRAFSNFKVTMNNEVIFSGDIKTVVADIKQALEENKDKGLTVWKDGVRVKVYAGVKWVGSESNFELTVDSLDLNSTEKSPLVIAEVIKEIEKMDTDIKTNHEKYATTVLTFTESPKSSFLLSKLTSAFKS